MSQNSVTHSRLPIAGLPQATTLSGADWRMVCQHLPLASGHAAAIGMETWR